MVGDVERLEVVIGGEIERGHCDVMNIRIAWMYSQGWRKDGDEGRGSDCDDNGGDKGQLRDESSMKQASPCRRAEEQVKVADGKRLTADYVPRHLTKANSC